MLTMEEVGAEHTEGIEVDHRTAAGPGRVRNGVGSARREVVGHVRAPFPGQLGGVRGLAVLRSILSNIRVIVIPTQMAIARANDAFDEDGSLKDERQQAGIEAIGAEVVRFARGLSEVK